MPITSVRKTKGTRTCADCGSNLAAGATKCQNCGSTNIKKSLLVITKSESVSDVPGQEPPDIPEPEVKPTNVSEDLEADDRPEHDDVASDEVDDTEYEEEDEELEDDEDESDDEDLNTEDEPSEEEDDEEEPKVKKSVRVVRKSAKPTMSASMPLEAALMMLTASDAIIKAATGSDPITKMDEELTLLCNAFDAASESWADGGTIAKGMDPEMRAKLQAKLKSLKAKAAQLMGGKDPDDDGDDDTTPEGDTDHDTYGKDGKPVKKNAETEDIYKGLHPEIAKQLKEAEAIVERDKTTRFEELAKSLGQEGDNAVSVGKTLRYLSETNEEAFETMKATLAAAHEENKQGAIFRKENFFKR